MYNKEVEVMYYQQILNNFNFGFNYYIDEYNNYWFSYDDICNNLEFSNRKSKEYYNDNINEYDKCNNLVSNFRNDFNEESKIFKKFISYNALMNLIDRNNRRNNSFIKVIHSLYTRNESYITYGEDGQINELINNFIKSSVNKDYEELFICAYEITNSETCKDILDKAGVIDKDKEEIIDDFRYDLYDDCDEIEWRAVKRRYTLYEEESKKLYKYECTNGSALQTESSAPSWLRKCIK